MRATTPLIAVAVALLPIVAGCGGDGTQGGSLTARALWEQPAGGASQRGTTGGFGTTLPPAVESVAIEFQSQADGIRRCAAVDPDEVPVGSTGQRLVVLRDLPVGPGTVTVSGYLVAAAIAEEICLGIQPGTPTFRSDPHAVTIIAGTRTDAGDIPVLAQPFPLPDLTPPPNGSTVNPAVVRFTVGVSRVPAAVAVDPGSILVELAQGGELIEGVELAVTACDDSTSSPCSAGGSLNVSGYAVQTAPAVLAQGTAGVRIRAATLGAARFLDLAYLITVQTPPFGTVSGNVVDCLTDEPIAGATVIGVMPDLPPVVTDSDGSFTFADVPFGSFLLAAGADGFIDARLGGTLRPARPTEMLTLAMCPTGGTGLRVVLTWGSGPPAPADLDAHLRGPAADVSVGEEPVEFHLDFSNPDVIFPVSGAAVLDIDSTDFSGPETETVDQLVSGIYRYCVHDFTNRDATGSRALAESDARVRVFLGDEEQGEFAVPDMAGNVWEVFQLEVTGSVLTLSAIGEISAESDRALVCRRPDDADGDGLTDRQEQLLQTDPDNLDSNGNGVSDGQDVINGDAPARPGV